MSSFGVILDACVLYPAALVDLLLRLQKPAYIGLIGVPASWKSCNEILQSV